MPQALLAQLVSQDSKAREGSKDLLVNRSLAAAAPSLKSSLPRVLIYEVPRAHLDHLGHQDLPLQAPEAPKETKASQGSQPQVPVLWDSTCRDHQAHRDPKVTKVILEFLLVPLKGDHHLAPCSCRAPQAPLDRLGLLAPSAALAWRFSSTSLSTCRVTVLGLTSLEFRVPRAHLVPPGLSPPSLVRLSTTQSWQASS